MRSKNGKSQSKKKAKCTTIPASDTTKNKLSERKQSKELNVERNLSMRTRVLVCQMRFFAGFGWKLQSINIVLGLGHLGWKGSCTCCLKSSNGPSKETPIIIITTCIQQMLVMKMVS